MKVKGRLRNMAKGKKIGFNFDRENDILFIYDSSKKSRGSIEYGRNVHISFAGADVVGLEILGASKFLTGISKIDVSQDDLAALSECDLYTKRENGLLFVTFVCKFGKKSKPLENYLTLQDVDYSSPLVASA